MKIGIDARLINETGVGRYIRNLLLELSKLDKEYRFVIFFRKEAYDTFFLPSERWEKRLADIPWHSFAEQVVMPWLYSREHVDLVHVPYFNVPLLYTGKMIETVHDLIILHVDTGRATTLPFFLYKIRRLGYILALRIGLKRASHVLTVSETTKQEIIDHMHIAPSKITVTHEGVTRQPDTGSSLFSFPYFLYVGNAYPHKNIDILLAGYKAFLGAETGKQYKLVCVGKEDFFYRQAKKQADRLGLEKHVIFFGGASENELASLYQHAAALVLPSLMEGFGLPAVEALAYGTPVVCSDIPVFHELLKDLPVYFSPSDVGSLHGSLVRVLKVKRDKAFAKKIHSVISAYTWRHMAEQTLDTYRKVLSQTT